MGKETGIKWTDSTYNSWWGCTKVGPACDDCYAEAVDARMPGDAHWGHGAPRRLLSEHARNEPYRWNKQASKFALEHGRKRRVFTLSMGDLFDNEVPDDWRRDHMRVMEDCNQLEWQICTKRVSNIAKMVYPHWLSRREEIPTGVMENGYEKIDAGPIVPSWPRHIGVLITVVTQAEADRDCPRLLNLKKQFNIPWVGISYEPAQEAVDYLPYIEGSSYGAKLDWIIFGGKSGAQWNDRPFDAEWARPLIEQCAWTDTAFFFKQVSAFRPTDDMIPPDLLVRQWPEGH